MITQSLPQCVRQKDVWARNISYRNMESNIMEKNKICNECGNSLDKFPSEVSGVYCNQCDTPPDDYIKVGSSTLMYMNAYEVTRVCGGPAEGGDWYNHYSPLASIPIKAISHEGHDESCGRCNDHRMMMYKPGTDELVSFCRFSFHLKPDSENTVNMMRQYLEDIFDNIKCGNIYSVCGGAELHVILEDHPGEATEPYQYE
jgi:hypothetical protein